MSNLFKRFEDNNKALFVFEWDGKIATIAPELMAFEGYMHPKKSWNDVKEREEFEIEVEFLTLQGDALKTFKEVLSQSDDLSLVVTDSVTTLYEQYKSVPRLDLVLEEGVYGVMYASNSGHANKFKKFMRRDVNPSINKQGKYDSVEKQLSSIEDSAERQLKLQIHSLEQTVTLRPNDFFTSFALSNAKQELENYLHKRDIELLKQKQNETENKVLYIEESFENVKETMEVIQDEQWRDKINKMLKQIAISGYEGDFAKANNAIYGELDKRAKSDIDRRLVNYKERLERTGATKTVIKRANKLDVIQMDDRLKNTFSLIVKESFAKYCS